MPSTLTARGEDGKQSKKIERNIRKAGFCRILLRWRSLIVVIFARGLIGAQSGVMGVRGCFSGFEAVFASKLCSYKYAVSL